VIHREQRLNGEVVGRQGRNEEHRDQCTHLPTSSVSGLQAEQSENAMHAVDERVAAGVGAGRLTGRSGRVHCRGRGGIWIAFKAMLRRASG